MNVARAMPALRLPRSQAVVLALVAVIILGVTVLHYLTSAHLLEYHTVYRSLYYLPIAGAAVAFGLRGGLAVSAVVTVLYLPHVLGMGETLPGGTVDNLLELPVFLLVGGLVGFLADRERAQRRRVEGLRSYIDAVLQSLPLGVATASGVGPPTPQNRAAHTLLPALPPEALARPPALGYYSFEQGQRPLGLYVSPLDVQLGSDDSRVLVIEDLTDRRALEAQLRRVDRLASVGQLAAGVAHEVRNPLAIVRATAQLLASQAGDNASLRQYTSVLTSESDRIERLISDLLEYARPRPPLPTPLDLAGFLDAAAQQVRPYALQQGVSVLAEAPTNAMIVADAEQLGQALLNLLLNAVQASMPGGTVRLVGRPDTSGTQILVVDTGSGMPAEVQERACDPFFTTRPEGTGLGLALVAAVVQEHGGQLRFTSAVGQGTCVSISIPQEVPMARVLVIDDEPNMRWVLQEALGTAGYHTHSAGSGEEALALLAETPVDLAILDLKLKGMDGLATLRQIHARWPDVVVLILTAFGTVATAVEALQSGASDYLRKPFDVEEVLFKVSRALERQHLHAEIARLKGGEPPANPGSDPAWRAAIAASADALARGLDVRLSGEPGSGRASVGRAAHLASPRSAAPLVVCDLGVLPAAEQGALLDGDGRGERYWRAAGSGLLLLRHIGKLSRSGADALTRLLERRSASGVGPLLLLTGTAEEWAAAPALPHRHVAVAVPPLRAHLDDLLPFVATWLPNRAITPAAAELLHAYSWPGNLGELRAALERADKLAGAGPIEVQHLPERVRSAPLPNTAVRLPPEGLSLEALEIALIRQALARAGGNKTRAAELLGLTRHTLLYRLEKYKIADT